MKKIILFILITIGLTIGISASALTVFNVQQGGTGVSTITGVIKGNGISPFSVAGSADVIASLGYTPYNSSNPNNYIASTNLSATNPITYNSSTGAIGWTNSNNYISNISGQDLSTASNAVSKFISLGSLTGDSPISYNSTTGHIGFTNPGYITGNQTITLGGILSGSGSTSITASAAAGYYMPTTTDQTNWNGKQSALTFSTGLTNSSGTVTVNTSQNISTLSNLTSNGLIKTSGGTGALSIATVGTDYAPATSGTSILKGNGSGGFSNASAGTDYQSPLTFSGNLVNTSGTVSDTLISGKSGGQTIIGGTGTTDSLNLQSTSGVGATGATINFKVGNNGATTAMTILNNGNVGIGNTSPTSLLSVGSTSQFQVNSSGAIAAMTGETNSGNISLIAASPVIDSTTGTLSINTTTNKPVTFGTGLVTANNLASSSAAITGGSINSTPIGATAPSTGKFTTDQATTSESSPLFSSIGASALSIDTGATGSYAINIAPTNATSIVFGNVTTNPTYAFNGSGTFATSTGTNTFNGNVSIASGKTFTLIGTGASTFGGALTSTGLLTASNGLTVSAGTISLPATSIANAALQGSGTLTVTAGTGLSGGGSVALGSSVTLSLPNTGTAGTYGSATQVPVVTTDAQGRVTSVVNTTISGTAPGGSASGDLSGTYPSPTVAKINGVALGSTTATAGNLLIGSGTQWVTQVVTGDVTIGSTGVTAIGAGKVLNAMLGGSIAASKLVGTDITTVGALASGSIASGFGTILTGNTITGTTINGTTGINTGAGAGTNRIDVNGNLVNIGTITSGLINGQTISSTANFTGTVNVAGLTTLAGNISLTSATPVIDSTTGTLSINTVTNKPVTFGTGLASFGGALTVTGNTQLTGTTGIGAAAVAGTILNVATKVLSGTNAYGLQVTAPSGATNNYAASFMGGNVGIGTTSPSSPLQVQSPSSTGRNALFTTNDYNGTSTGTSLAISFGATSGNTASYISAFNSGSTAYGSLILNSGGGNVGIGTTSPGAKLDINTGGLLVEDTTTNLGSVSVSSNARQLLITGQPGAGASGAPLYINPATSGGAGRLLAAFGINGTNYFTTDVSGNTYIAGNVGIGTTSPGSKLTVTSGDIEIKTNTTGIIMHDTTNSTLCYRIQITSGLVVPTSISCP